MPLVSARDVRIGDRLRARDGTELTVTRIDEGFLGRPEMLAFVEDSPSSGSSCQRHCGEVELVERSS